MLDTSQKRMLGKHNNMWGEDNMYTWPKSPAYTISSIALWIAFLAAIATLEAGYAANWPPAAIWALALVPAATVLVQTVLAYRLIAKQDEFIRALTAKRMVVAFGVTLAVAAAWGPAQDYLNVPHVSMWLIYPLFWGLFGITSLFFKGSYA